MLISVLILTLSAGWLFYEPGFEPLIAILASIPNIFSANKGESKKELKIGKIKYIHISIIIILAMVLIKISNTSIIGIKGDNNNNNTINISNE